MLNLFSLDENWRVVIKPETLFLKPFEDVMKKYKNRETGLFELGFIYYMVDYRSDFSDITNPEVRKEKILETFGDRAKDLKIDKVTDKAIKLYEERQPSISLRHLESMKKALTNLQESLDAIDLAMMVTDAITGELKPVYDTMALKRITDIITASPKLIASIKEMEKQVRTEIQENTKHVGSGEKSIYEDE